MTQVENNKINQESAFNITPQHVANFFLDQAEQEKHYITQLKLLKLVYMGYGWVAAVLEKKLFNEPIEAWQHGPVVASLYHEFKHFGNKPITNHHATTFDLEEGKKATTPRIDDIEELGELNFILKLVWDIYKRYSAWDLRNKTHEADTPWKSCYEKNQTKAIEFSAIRDHFSERISRYLDNDQKNT